MQDIPDVSPEERLRRLVSAPRPAAGRNGGMNIGQAATASGVSAKMIRYYEQIGLITSAERTDGNYRHFGAREISELRFIKRARSLGFSVEAIAKMLSLWRDRHRTSTEIKTLADTYAVDVEMRVAEMRTIACALRELSAHCDIDARPSFPSLADVSKDPSATAQRPEPPGLIAGEGGPSESNSG
jgi:MerR family copper efflux transcriptional regulator